MKRFALSLVAALLLAAPASAADNFVVKDGTGVIAKKCARDVGGAVLADCAVLTDGAGVEKGTDANPLANKVVTLAASSTACAGTITSSAATLTEGAPAGCAATIAAGAGKIGPFKPQLGRAVRLIATGTWVGTLQLGTSIDGCATVNVLTAAGTPITYSGNVNEWADAPVTSLTSTLGYCLVGTISSGTASIALRN